MGGPVVVDELDSELLQRSTTRAELAKAVAVAKDGEANDYYRPERGRADTRRVIRRMPTRWVKPDPAVLLSVAFGGTAYRRSVLRTLNSRIARCSMRLLHAGYACSRAAG